MVWMSPVGMETYKGYQDIKGKFVLDIIDLVWHDYIYRQCVHMP